MAPITAIIDKTSPDDSVIKLFYATGKAQLGLSLWPGTKDADPEDPIQPPQEVGNGQYILNPSQMASVNLQGVERVFTLTTDNPFKVTPDDFYNLSEISESKQKQLAGVAIGNTTLAACGNGESAWVYYSRTFGNGRILVELNLQTSQSTDLTGTFGLWINSFAAAWYDPTIDRRCLIYETSSLVEFVVGSDSPAVPIQPTGDMQRNTPVAVAFENGKVFLYYCGTGAAGGIRRTVKTNNTWGISTLIDSRTISQDSQLTVVRANGINHLFFVARDQNEEEDDYFVHYADEIS
ncbi:uncharacterized protein FSUBG_10798 [Fusarium subglutinans]|uniref:Fucose-specific lectin n=1 Tax=Gibberella subglutinans TaxID=42677 RepID=A0A8H5LFM6_GIBSU|nr:uncharacterized protein FSUBG_10798 [Fusarium subglutinans]KAF5590582.1 hypothetical protein FSUBG_10798 [Fusarium subglutinans]